MLHTTPPGRTCPVTGSLYLGTTSALFPTPCFLWPTLRPQESEDHWWCGDNWWELRRWAEKAGRAATPLAQLPTCLLAAGGPVAGSSLLRWPQGLWDSTRQSLQMHLCLTEVQWPFSSREAQLLQSQSFLSQDETCLPQGQVTPYTWEVLLAPTKWQLSNLNKWIWGPSLAKAP